VRLEVVTQDGTIAVEIGRAAGKQALSVGGREFPCEWTRLPDGGWLLLAGREVFDLRADLDGDHCAVCGRGGRFLLRIVDPRRLPSGGNARESAKGPRRILAEMPGKIVRLLVKPGERVEAGQGLLVLEAMKMQNEIPAPRAGVVLELAVKAGSATAAGDHLATIE